MNHLPGGDGVFCAPALPEVLTDYDKLTENLSPGKCKFKVYFYFILITCFVNYNLFILLYSQSI
jgi:hypothetical protein